MPSIEDFLDGGGPRSPPPPPPPQPSISGSLFNSSTGAVLPPTEDFNVLSNRTLPSISTHAIGNNLFDSQAATAVRENKTKTQQNADDFL